MNFKNFRKILCFSALLLCSPLFAQENWKIMNELEYHYQRIDYWRSRLNNDSAVYEESLLRSKLLTYTSDASTLKQNFKYLKYYDGLTVLTSDDKLFRIYSWDDGTKEQHHYINVFQYKNNDKVESAMTMHGVDAGAQEQREYKDVYTLKAKDRTYYLARYIVRKGKGEYSVGLEVFSRDANGMNDSSQIIVTNTYGMAVDNIELEVSNISSGALSHTIYFNKFRKLLYVPIIWQDGVVSTAYTTYKFKDHYFTEVKEEAKKQKRTAGNKS